MVVIVLWPGLSPLSSVNNVLNMKIRNKQTCKDLNLLYTVPSDLPVSYTHLTLPTSLRV